MSILKAESSLLKQIKTKQNKKTVEPFEMRILPALFYRWEMSSGDGP